MNNQSDQPTQTARRAAGAELEPLLVSVPTAKRLLDIGNTKFWAMVKVGRIEMVDIGTGRRSVSYASIKKLVSSPLS